MIENSATLSNADISHAQKLNRVVSLPMLIFYGVGVTVGAGIFALSGEVVGISGNFAPWSFLLAAFIAGLTAVSYAIQSNDSPRAAGEAWYVRQAFGEKTGIAIGLLLVLSALLSSAAIAVAFGNYLGELVSLPKKLLILIAIITISLVAWKGIKETVVFAALITLIEVGALVVVIAVGMPDVLVIEDLPAMILPQSSVADYSLIFTGAIVAFFAFIGFEDIVNMGEEAINAERSLPIAIIATLIITLLIYALVSVVCVAAPDRSQFLSSDAPLAYIFESTTGRNPWVISLCAAIAMINGILVQLVMASRVLYGLSTTGSLPKVFAYVDRNSHTPSFSIVFVASIILAFALTLNLVNLAKYSSFALLVVFCTVNLALWFRNNQNGKSEFGLWKYWGLLSFFACAALLGWQLISAIRS